MRIPATPARRPSTAAGLATAASGLVERRLSDGRPAWYHSGRCAELHALAVDPSPTAHRAQPPLAAEATLDLLDRVKQGDRTALDTLLERCIPALNRWAHGRLPASARGMEDTADLVQTTVMSALRRLQAFESRHQGALQAYLRQALMNRIRDLVRQRDRRPVREEMPEQLADDGTSPLELAIGAENVARYEAALQRLRPSDREAIVNRIELQLGYDELAVALDKPTAQAARMAVMRAMRRLAEEMRRGV
jgi:RNA polymerase sigma-70 factor (ECF subfamily)